VATDRRLTRALAGWKRCMTARGFRYPSPDTARQHIYKEMSSAERAAAVALARTRASALERARRILGAAESR
jgi:hypothetical protein